MSSKKMVTPEKQRKMKRLLVKLSIIWKVLFKFEHFVVVNLDRKNLENLLREKDVAIQVSYLGLKPYLYFKIFETVLSTKSDIDMALDKAQFEAEAISISENKKKK